MHHRSLKFDVEFRNGSEIEQVVPKVKKQIGKQNFEHPPTSPNAPRITFYIYIFTLPQPIILLPRLHILSHVVPQIEFILRRRVDRKEYNVGQVSDLEEYHRDVIDFEA